MTSQYATSRKWVLHLNGSPTRTEEQIKCIYLVIFEQCFFGGGAHCLERHPIEGVQHRMVLVVHFFLFLFFCFVVAMCDLVHDVEDIFHLSELLTASGNIF